MHVGILLCCAPRQTRKETLRNLQQEFLARVGPQGKGVVGVNMPCGHRAVFAAVEDLPTTDLPCTCGNPEHWFIKWHDAPVPKANIWKGPLALALFFFLCGALCFAVLGVASQTALHNLLLGCSIIFLGFTSYLWWERRRNEK